MPVLFGSSLLEEMKRGFVSLLGYSPDDHALLRRRDVVLCEVMDPVKPETVSDGASLSPVIEEVSVSNQEMSAKMDEGKVISNRMELQSRERVSGESIDSRRNTISQSNTTSQTNTPQSNTSPLIQSLSPFIDQSISFLHTEGLLATSATVTSDLLL